MTHIPNHRDGDLHHEDGSHRWTGGGASEAQQEAHRAKLEEHMRQHKEGADRPSQRGGSCAR